MALESVTTSLISQTPSANPNAILEPILTSTLDQLKASAANATSYLNPSTNDLLMVLPRIAARASTFIGVTIPDTFEHIFGAANGGRIIAEATGEGAQAVAAASAGLQEAVGAGVNVAAAADTGGQMNSFSHLFGFQQVRTFGGV